MFEHQTDPNSYLGNGALARARNMGYRAVRTETAKYVRYSDPEGMGEPYDLTDWTGPGFGGPALISWTTLGFGANPDANALRWGTTYNFRFDATSPPQAGSIEIGYFLPGSPGSVSISALVPSAATPVFSRGDCNGDGLHDISDPIAALGLIFLGGSSSCEDSCDTDDDGTLTVADAITLLDYHFSSGIAPSPPFPACMDRVIQRFSQGSCPRCPQQ